MDRSAGHSIQKRVNPLGIAHQNFRDLLEYPLPHSSSPLPHSWLPSRQMHLLAVFTPHATSSQEVVLADDELRGAVIKSLGVHWKAILVDDGAAERVTLMLILASFREAYLALEEDVLPLFINLTYFVGFQWLRPPSRQSISDLRLC